MCGELYSRIIFVVAEKKLFNGGTHFSSAARHLSPKICCGPFAPVANHASAVVVNLPALSFGSGCVILSPVQSFYLYPFISLRLLVDQSHCSSSAPDCESQSGRSHFKLDLIKNTWMQAKSSKDNGSREERDGKHTFLTSTTMRSIRNAFLAFTLLIAYVFLKADASPAENQTCSTSDLNVLSCSPESLTTNSCCVESPGGLLIQAQLYNWNPGLGPADSWTIHGLWPDFCNGQCWHVVENFLD